MAGFRTHITTSTIVGFGYAGAGVALGLPYPSSVLAGGICSVAGMMPDLDSDTGVPLRESSAFAAAVFPLLMIDRLEYMQTSVESIVLFGSISYLIIRFGLHRLLSRYTVHRGMFHSIPALCIIGLLTFLVCSSHQQPIEIRYFKSGGAMLGYLSHLLLDEIYSIKVVRGRIQLKKSFGTATKFWGRSLWGNVSAYGKLGLLAFLVFQDPILREQIQPATDRFEQIADRAADRLRLATNRAAPESEFPPGELPPTNPPMSAPASVPNPAREFLPGQSLFDGIVGMRESPAEAILQLPFRLSAAGEKSEPEESPRRQESLFGGEDIIDPSMVELDERAWR